MADRYPTSAIPDRPEFDVAVDGTSLEALVQQDVMEIDVHEEIGRHGRLSLLVQNWDADALQVRHSDDGPFAPGKAIDVKLGYHAQLDHVFGGVITAITCHFPAKSGPTLQVEARSKSALLANPPRSRLFESSSDGDMAQAIASDYGLQADAETGVSQDAIVQDDRGDWTALVERAEVLGWVTYVRDDTLVFRPPASPTGDEPELTWGTNLTELHLTEDVGRAGDPVQATGWDAEDLAETTADADGDRSEIGSGDRASVAGALGDAGWAQRAEVRPASAPLTAQELDRVALGRVNRYSLEHWSGSATTVGLPRLRIDGWVKVVGAGRRMSGPHYLAAVRHRVGPAGFHTELQFGLPGRLPRPDPQPCGGRLRLGVVADLDDPLGWGRVKVRFPWRTDAPDAVWARLATLDAGPSQGTWFVPDVGQEVLVGSVDDDDRFPVVLGALWNGQQSPPVSIDPDVNGIRAIVSRSGHKVEFDDGDAAVVRVVTAKGHELTLDDAGGTVEMKESGAGNSVKLAQDGITISAQQGDVSISAPSGKIKLDGSGLEGNATGPAKLESSATLDIKAAATLGIKGALVNIN